MLFVSQYCLKVLITMTTVFLLGQCRLVERKLKNLMFIIVRKLIKTKSEGVKVKFGIVFVILFKIIVKQIALYAYAQSKIYLL